MVVHPTILVAFPSQANARVHLQPATAQHQASVAASNAAAVSTQRCSTASSSATFGGSFGAGAAEAAEAAVLGVSACVRKGRKMIGFISL